jgi:hypothetical protein
MKTILSRFLLAVCAIGTTSCAVGIDPGPSTVSMPLHYCKDDPAAPCILPDISQVEELQPSDTAPRVGLALSGGGSKSAPYAMGVLKRFVENEWIYRTDYLTSVSGGSYSALYLYYNAWRLASEIPSQHPYDWERGTEAANPPYSSTLSASDDPPPNDPPLLTRFFIDSRDFTDEDTTKTMHATFHTRDALQPWPAGEVYSLAEYPHTMAPDGCYDLTQPVPAGAAPTITKVEHNVGMGIHQGWVECYQDLLMTRHAPESTYRADTGALGKTTASLVAESFIAAPVHWTFNLLFDWRKRLSPTQYDYEYGILRTYAYLPPAGQALPINIYNPQLRQLQNAFHFEDLAVIYTPAGAAKVGGLLPKWILQATANSGNVAFDLSSEPYDLGTTPFEITLDEFGSGRYGYVKGSPSIVGLTVPLAVLSSAAYADTAQRSLTYPRWAVNGLLNLIDLRWGFDIPNYNTSNAHRVFHSFLPFPFYYLDDSKQGHTGPTIHLSDGGQSGDNLGLVALFRRNVPRIIVASGEQDTIGSTSVAEELSSELPKTWRVVLGSLCSANWYLVERGYTMVFETTPTAPWNTVSPAEAEERAARVKTSASPADVHFDGEFDLSQHCKWDEKQEHIGILDTENVTPLNWSQYVWHGFVRPMKESEARDMLSQHFNRTVPAQSMAAAKEQQKSEATATVGKTADAAYPFKPTLPNLTGVQVFYLMSALNRLDWTRTFQLWANQIPSQLNSTLVTCPDFACSPVAAPPATGNLASCKGWSVIDGRTYNCSLITYTYDLDDALRHENKTWEFPQTSTAFTTYNNSFYLFRAYRDLGWLYAGELAQYPSLMQILNGPPNHASAANTMAHLNDMH